MATMSIFKGFFLCCLGLLLGAVPPVCAGVPGLPDTSSPVTLMEVAREPRLFDPARGETVGISFRTSRPAKTILRIFDPEMGLVREFITESSGALDVTRVVWDGKDMHGKIVPDEAYFFTLEAADSRGNSAFYDPTTISGREAVVPDNLHYDAREKVASYRLPQDARVKMRAGIRAGGPLLKAVLSNVPRLSGEHREPWDGKDETGIVQVIEHGDYALTVEAISLVENSVVTSGNALYDYFAYKNEVSPGRPKKVERPFRGRPGGTPELELSPMAKMIPEPKFRIELSEMTLRNERDVPIVSGRIPIKLNLEDSIKKFITEQRYEIIFFLDFQFVTEREEGYSPFTFLWNTRETPNGEHVITFNVATFTGQVSSASAKVMVWNE